MNFLLVKILNIFSLGNFQIFMTKSVRNEFDILIYNLKFDIGNYFKAK